MPNTRAKPIATFCVCVLAATGLAAGAPATQPAVDPALNAKLEEVDARTAKIKDFAARFEQRKYTALLRKPLVSTGTVRVVGSTVRWDTEAPEPSVLFMDGKELRVYSPRQKLLEVYPIDRRMSELAASPLPRLAALRQSFSFEPLATAEMRKDAPDVPASADQVAVRLRPTTDVLKEHVREVRVLLGVKTGLMLCVVTVDADGDRTVARMIDPRTDTGLKPTDLQLAVPADVKVSRPTGGSGAN